MEHSPKAKKVVIILLIIIALILGVLSLREVTGSISGRPRTIEQRPTRLRQLEKDRLHQENKDAEALGRRIELLLEGNEDLTFEEAKKKALEAMQIEVATKVKPVEEVE